ncbi:MAG: PilZ domain-containing protein [Elusimicrobia bacterium]|nr:PilZ domain-containing protein [Elusimicrobiota bacterium]
MNEMRPTQRKHKRKATLVLLYVADSNDPGKVARAAVVDISMGGAAFESSIKFSAGDEVILRFTLPKEKIYVINGVIRRTSERTGALVYGVQFKEMNFFGKFRLRKLISKLDKLK